MPSKHDRRMRILETGAVTMQRRTLPGLVALCESGQLHMEQLTDEELQRLVAGLPGAVPDMRHLSDAELEAILAGRHHGHN
jgi:hypothetical protein